LETSQQLKETALGLADRHLSVQVENQVHVITETIKEQLKELQGRQNQMAVELKWLKDCEDYLEKRRKEMKKKRKSKKS